MKTLSLVALSWLAACGDNIQICDPEAPNSICTIAGHTLDEGYHGDDGLAIDADLFIPMDSVVAPDGTVWFIDFNNYVVRQIDDQGVIHTVIGNHRLGDSPSDLGVATVAALDAANNHTPTMAFANGYVYLAAWHESRLKRVRLSDMMMENVGGRGTRAHYDGDGAAAMKAGVDEPSSIAFDPQGNLTFMDQGNLVVRQIDSAGLIHTLVGACIIEAADCATHPPVACPGSSKLVCGDPATDCITNAGTGETGTPDPSRAGNVLCTQRSGGDNGPAILARINLPYTQSADPVGRIAYDHKGNLIIAEAGGNRIRKVDAQTQIITTIAGTGNAGYSGDGGPATQAELSHPVDVAIGDDDSVYFADTFNHCIRKIDPDGIVSRVAGVCQFTDDGGGGDFSGDGGPPLEAHLQRPYGIDLVGTKLYISDSYNNRLRLANLPSP